MPTHSTDHDIFSPYLQCGFPSFDLRHRSISISYIHITKNCIWLWAVCMCVWLLRKEKGLRTRCVETESGEKRSAQTEKEKIRKSRKSCTCAGKESSAEQRANDMSKQSRQRKAATVNYSILVRLLAMSANITAYYSTSACK